ncbi:MAG: hypothetical protein KAJ37_00380, partial [Candidatus Krumholzibacteria bacterium]|nr:hypothetical protein [Candidatus Krumholzibacteria bacterium]
MARRKLPGKTNAAQAAALRKRWKAREAYIKRTFKFRSFVSAMAYVYSKDVHFLLAMVYGKARKYRSSTLHRSEIPEVKRGGLEYLIKNTARSRPDGFNYSYIVAYGHPGRNAPTKLRGKKWYAWVDPPHPRPASHDGPSWRRGLAEGWAHRSRRFAKRPARNWRNKAIAEAKKTLP